MTTVYPIPDEVLPNHIAILGKTGSGKSNAAATMCERLMQRKARVCIIDPTDRYWGLRLAADGKQASKFEPVIFGGAHADMPLGETHGATLAEVVATTTTPTIISTRALTVGQRTRFFTAFAETLLQKNEGPLHLVIDEAHLFAPQQGASAARDVPAMLHATNNLVGLGRGVGLRIALLSQRPAKLHNDALGQVETLIAFRLILPHDQRAVRDWLRDYAGDKIVSDIMGSLASLPTGEAWLYAPEREILRRATFPLVATFDSGKPGHLGAAPPLQAINLDNLKGRLEVVAKEAVENDPRRLKLRIADLEKKLGAAPAADPAAIERARDMGYQDGFADAQREITAHLGEAMRDRQAAIDGALGHLIAFANREGDGVPVIDVRRSPKPPTIEQRPQRRQEPRAIPRPRPNGSAVGELLPKGERACLIAIAQHDGGVTREQLTILTGYKRSTRDAYVQRLRDRGHIELGGNGIMATGEGIAALGADYEPLPTGDELREHWLGRLPEGERKVLEAAIGFYPDAVTRDEIGETTGYKRSTRDAYIQRLRARMLVIADAAGVRAVDTLFDG